MQNTAFAEQGVDALYLPVCSSTIWATLCGLRRRWELPGFSVTIPHKQAILRYLDWCDPLAAEIGAVNTVLMRGTRLYGYNTDYVGVLQAIEKHVSLRFQPGAVGRSRRRGARSGLCVGAQGRNRGNLGEAAGSRLRRWHAPRR
jgi:shikimate 5-dehydrogenase